MDFNIENVASQLRYAGVSDLLILVHVSNMWSCEGEELINVAIGPSSEARATELRSLQSEDRGIVVSFHLTNFNSLFSVQLRQHLYGLYSAKNMAAS